MYLYVELKCHFYLFSGSGGRLTGEAQVYDWTLMRGQLYCKYNAVECERLVHWSWLQLVKVEHSRVVVRDSGCLEG